MFDMFNSLNDDIFLNEKIPMVDDVKINNICKKYLDSHINVKEKNFFLKLRKQYFMIKNIVDYEEKQGKLYSGKNKREVINFEISRIKSKDNLNNEILEQITNIENLLLIYDNKMTDELYARIIDKIIKIEISLDMQIGLFNELCSLFEKEIDNIEKETVVDTMTYAKRK